MSLRIFVRLGVLAWVSVSLVSCVAPALTRQSDLAVLSGRDTDGLTLMASSQPAAPPPRGEVFQDQLAVKPGMQDIVVCVRESYVAGTATVIRNDKFAVFRENLKAGRMYLVRAVAQKREGRGWSTPAKSKNCGVLPADRPRQ
jgi:hypothetical protein